MAKKTTRTKSRSRTAKHVTPEELIPTPPPAENVVALHVDIPGKVGWRLKLALLRYESLGQKKAKKDFVHEALVEALDRLEQEWGGANG